MASLVDRLGLNGQTKNIRLGKTFYKGPKSSGEAYHTIRYDFKPQSMDSEKMGTVEIMENHAVTVTVPHREGSGQSQTVFNGNEKPLTKECVLIIDNDTGEISLEKLSYHINVKKTREEGNSRVNSHCPSTLLKRSPSQNLQGDPAGFSPRSHPSPSHQVSPHSEMSPHHISNSSPSQSPNNSFMSTTDYMPMLGIDVPNMDSKIHETGLVSDSSSAGRSVSSSSSVGVDAPNMDSKIHETGLVSDSSSPGRSVSSSSSVSDSGSEPNILTPKESNEHIGGAPTIDSDSDSEPNIPTPENDLNDDLQLSDDDSD